MPADLHSPTKGDAFLERGRPRRSSGRPPGRAERRRATALVASLAWWYGLAWVLDESQRELLLRLRPGAFDDNKGDWAFCLTQASALKGDATNVRTYADEARKALGGAASRKARRRAASLQSSAWHSRTSAERKRRSGRDERGVALMPVAKNAVGGPTFRPTRRESTSSSARRRRRSTSSSPS